jgi:hypothetical protein
MEKKTLELSTALVGMSGLFCTYWGYGNSENTLHEDMIESDFEEGHTDIHPDYYWTNFNSKKYMEAINERVHSFMEEFLYDLLKEKFGIEVEYLADGYTSPREYNFGGDEHNFDLVAESFEPVLDYCLNHEDFEGFLKDNYSSRDGFISFTANSVDELLQDIVADEMTAWGAVFSFLISQEVDRDSLTYVVVEALSEDMYYSEFVDVTELDEFLEELRTKRLGHLTLDTEWKVALFNRDIDDLGNINMLVKELYRTETFNDIVEKILQDLGIETDDSKRTVIEKFVRSVFEEIESYNLKLEI